MTETPKGRKRNLKSLWLVPAVTLVVILIWRTTDENEIEVVEESSTEVPGERIPVDTALKSPVDVRIDAVLANPQAYIDTAGLSGTVSVAEVLTDRGFWIELRGQRMFAVIIDGPQGGPQDINSGQQLQITGGMVQDPTYLADFPGAPLDETTASTARQQPAFLVVDEANIEILPPG